MWRGALSVFRFEVRRTMTVSRIAVWLLLTLFPVFITSVLKHNEEGIKRGILAEIAADLDTPRLQYQKVPLRDNVKRELDRAVRPGAAAVGDEPLAAKKAAHEKELSIYMARMWSVVFFVLIPEVITLFGLLLWVPALVHAELEGHTWIYLAVRPRGRVSVLWGKYLTALAWTALAGWTSATACVLIAKPEGALRLWSTLVGLVALAGVAYGAIYSLIGVCLHRRAMVIAVAYTLIFEFLVSFIPAVINKFTVQYRLRNLLFAWLDWWDIIPPEATTVFLGNEPAWLHILVLIAAAAAVMAIAGQVIQRKEYVGAAEA